MVYDELFLKNLALMDRLIRFVCRRRGVTRHDAEEFASFVKLKLIENDYAILRRFEGKSTLGTYLSVVFHRLLCDYRNEQWGKWRPSAAAQKLGDAGVLVEALVVRDRCPVEEAVEHVLRQHPAARADELRRLAHAREKVPPAQTGLRVATPEDELAAKRKQAIGACASEQLLKTIRRWEPRDQLLLCFRFGRGLTVAAISRLLKTDQKRLYKRLDELLEQLRKSLVAGGLSEADLRSLLDGGPVALDIPLETFIEDRAAHDSGGDTDATSTATGEL